MTEALHSATRRTVINSKIPIFKASRSIIGSMSEKAVIPSGAPSSNGASIPNASSNSASHSSSSTTGMSPASFKLLLLVLMVLQNSATVLVGRYTRAGVSQDELYDVNHLLVVIELGKLLLSCALEHFATQGQLLHSIRTHVLRRPYDALKILIPALLYLVQNTLLYVALSNLTAPIFQVTYQSKLVTTAFVSVIMLQRQYSPQQWICLVCISLGVALVVLGEKGKSSTDQSSSNAQNLMVGLGAVSIACFSSALAGVYFEKVIKRPQQNSTDDAQKVPNASVWMRNMQLAFYSVVIALVQGFFFPAAPPPGPPRSYLHGFSTWTWMLVLLQAAGGLLVAAVIKYADNVLKGRC